MFSLIFVLNLTLLKANSNFAGDDSSDFNSYTPKQFSLGIQLKYLSGIGLASNLIVTEKFFVTGSASWLFSIFVTSFGSGYKLSNFFDGIFRFNYILITSGDQKVFLIFPELSSRFKLSKSFFIETGAIIPFLRENRKILADYLNVPFIINAGLVFIF